MRAARGTAIASSDMMAELCVGLTVDEAMKITNIDVEKALRDTPDVPVLMGGPVDPQRGFVLHSPVWGGQDTRHVADRWALTGSRDVLVAIAQGKGPRKWLAALGYAGWSAGQLEMELSLNGWFPTPATVGLIWEGRCGTRWAEGFRAAGIDARLLSAEMGHA